MNIVSNIANDEEERKILENINIELVSFSQFLIFSAISIV
jgi:hypothetical protein